jgi:hypothetical protein
MTDFESKEGLRLNGAKDISRPSFGARQALLGPLKVALQASDSLDNVTICHNCVDTSKTSCTCACLYYTEQQALVETAKH